jgi:hypothetical protein
MSEINAKNILKDAELIATVTHKLQRQHRKALSRKGETNNQLLPSFELCLKKGCKDLVKHYDLLTHKFIYPIKFCDKLVCYSQSEKKQPSKLTQQFSQRDLNLILVSLENSKLSESLVERVKALAKFSSVTVTTQ